VSQPSQRSGCCPAPGAVDETLGEFWSENPWDIITQGHNLSAYERNRTWLNLRGQQFLDISFLSGTDSDGDGRCVVAADFRNNGRLDLAVRQVGGGPFLLFANEFPQRHYLEVSLRGTRSNRLGIGARLTAEAGDLRLVREMYPANSFRSQAPCVAHFGLAGADRVRRLTIRWPSGTVQVLTDLAADRHVVVTEGKGGAAAVEAVVPGRTIQP
jgi:enediyne biosynthesis protein E4